MGEQWSADLCQWTSIHSTLQKTGQLVHQEFKWAKVVVTSQVNKYTSTQVHICSSGMPSKYSVQHFHWRNMKISVVFSNVQNYSLKNLQHNLCVQCSELVREVCEEKGHCHYYTVIWLFCESHTRSTAVDHLPGKQRGNHKVFHIFWWFRDDF